jgi:HAD superfamily hydrolase (TIGR01509 family)
LTGPAFVWLLERVIRALIFDFDGLVIDTETPLIDAWAAIHQRAGHAYSRSGALGLVGHVDVDFDPWTAFGAAADRAALDTEHRRLTRELTARQPILPGVLAYLEEGRRRGLKLAVASNSGHNHVERHLTRLGLHPFFDFIACREDIAAGKPAPEIYQLVTRKLALAPAEAVAFEDSRAGTVAARNAGVWTVAVPNPSTRHHDFSAAHRVVPSLADQPLADLLERFSAGETGG